MQIKRVNTEEAIHKAVVAYLRLVLPVGFLVHHCANKPRSAQQGAREKAMGALAGWPDLEVHGQDDAGLPRTWFLEVKPPRTSVPPHQIEMHDRLRDIGHKVAVVRSIDEVARWLKAWGVPTREVIA